MKSLKAFSLAAALITLVVAGTAAGQPGPVFIDGPGVELVKKKCTLCHDPAHFTSIRQTREEWEDTVGLMIRRGAPVTAEESRVIVEYLTTHYGRKK